ncbi:MAG: YabP/YqfC family sporulation protein [Ruminococcus sp.]|nr:YabP/YqfC family sporulation protein [Ruminococcus sp.]
MKKPHSRLKDLALISAGISVVDNKTVIIENVRKISECNDIVSVIESGRLIISIWGNDLKITSFDTGVVEVNGIITSIELEKVGR